MTDFILTIWSSQNSPF